MPPLVLLGVLGLLAYTARGITGAASAIVFNALFVVLLAFGATGELTLLDGLYWVALSDAISTLVMAVTLRHQLRLEPFVLRFLVAAVPLNVLFTLLLPRIAVGSLIVILAVAIIAAGGYLVGRRRLGVWRPETLNRAALLAGGGSGVLGGLFGMGGPTAFVLAAHAGDDPTRFRVRLLIMTLATSWIRLLVIAASGGYTGERLGWILGTLPMVGLGLAVGHRIHPHVPPQTFRIGLGALLVISGVTALAQLLVLR